jgi:hypothetical protein
MAKCKGPLFSEEARGSLGDELTFSKRSSGQQVRFQRKQKEILPSWEQANNRSLYRLAVARWNSFTLAEKAVFQSEVTQTNLEMSGFNLFVRHAMINPKTYIGLCFYLTFNRGTGDPVVDVSKNNIPGNLKPTYPSNCPLYVAGKNSKIQKALQLDGQNDYVYCDPGNKVDFDNDYTFCMWIKTSTLVQFGMLFYKTTNTKGYQMAYFNYPNIGKILYYCGTPGSGGSVTSNSSNLNNSTWRFLTFIQSGGVAKIYVDGQFDNQDNVVKTSPGASPLYLGTYANSRYWWNGIFSQHMFFNRVLSSAEILEIYDSFK